MLFYVLVLVISLSLIISEYKPIVDAKNSVVKCNNGLYQMPEEIGISLYSYSEDISYEDDKKARVACLTNSDLGEIAKSVYPVYSEIDNEELGKRIREKGDFSSLSRVSIDEKNYSLFIAHTNRDWVKMLGFSLLAISTTAVVFEFFRRVFYYIFLGKIFPKRKNESSNLG